MFDSIYSPPQPSVIRQYIKVKRSQANRLTPSFPPVGVTGFEPATTRPPQKMVVAIGNGLLMETMRNQACLTQSAGRDKCGVVAIRKITQQCFGFCCAIAEIFGRNISVSEERVHFTHA